ncbi:sodium:proton antiporter [Gallaecimonas sp. GXIMD4217]|uniref:cation:proton antiporter n=1 Tax=Gallaecimonas sp. GXIMD4217 TaxID=3131927 RepID=UPI00311AED44
MLTSLLTIALMLLLAMLLEPLARRLRLPFATLLVLVGFIGSELVLLAGFDTGFRWHHFQDWILHALVPVLVFESALNLRLGALKGVWWPVLVLAVPAMLLAAAISGLVLFLGIGHELGFPLLTALITGVMLSATDPVAVVALFKAMGAPERLHTLLEGESLFNDATAVVAFMVLLGLAGGGDISILEAIWRFGYAFGGGILAGAALGLLAWLGVRSLSEQMHLAAGSVILMLLTFHIAEHWLQVSGIVALVVAGLIYGESCRGKGQERLLTGLWEVAAYLANALVFLLVGVTVTWMMFADRWLAMLIGIAAAILARSLVIYGLLPLANSLPGQQRLPLAQRHVMMWGGLRGAVSLALALALPVTLEGWYTAQSVVYGFALFTLFVQAPLMPLLIRRL